MQMHQIVHLDLKGAPLRVTYLEKVLTVIKQWGATGILIEWEDTFPYAAELQDIGSQAERPQEYQECRDSKSMGSGSQAERSREYQDCRDSKTMGSGSQAERSRDDEECRHSKSMGSGGDGMYSMDEVKHILQFAQDLNMEAIQLIQTIGHMEFVLKHPSFSPLREAPRSPAVLCPSRPGSQRLVRGMLGQALAVQPGANYLHIGADEVWHTGICDLCKQRASTSKHKTASLYLDHIRDVAAYVKQMRPGITVLMWDDMLRSIGFTTLKAYDLSQLVQPVVWNYSPGESFHIDPGLWEVYRQTFPAVWAGSAFKGANGSCQMLSPVSRYTSNHEAWVREISRYQQQIVFHGIVLTGWSRFDHFATLCELLPVSLPSLASCLRVLNSTGQPASELVTEVLPSDQWPGESLARCIHSCAVLRERCNGLFNGDAVTTWLNPWQLKHNYTNPMQIEGLAMICRQLSSELTTLSSALSLHLDSITGARSSNEWYDTFITPIASRLTEITTEASLRANMDASVRPTGF